MAGRDTDIINLIATMDRNHEYEKKIRELEEVDRREQKESLGQISKNLTKLTTNFIEFKSKIEGSELVKRLGEVEKRVEHIEKSMATKSDIKGVSLKMDKLSTAQAENTTILHVGKILLKSPLVRIVGILIILVVTGKIAFTPVDKDAVDAAATAMIGGLN